VALAFLFFRRCVNLADCFREPRSEPGGEAETSLYACVACALKVDRSR
jgi:hypothetical protein